MKIYSPYSVGYVAVRENAFCLIFCSAIQSEQKLRISPHLQDKCTTLNRLAVNVQAAFHCYVCYSLCSYMGAVLTYGMLTKAHRFSALKRLLLFGSYVNDYSVETAGVTCSHLGFKVNMSL